MDYIGALTKLKRERAEQAAREQHAQLLEDIKNAVPLKVEQAYVTPSNFRLDSLDKTQP